MFFKEPILRPNDERDLIARAQSGDSAAISALYNRHVGRIYRYLLYRVNDPIIAEDITADVFTRVLESLSQYDDRGVPLGAWLYRIAHARLVDHWRKAQRRPTVALDDPVVQKYLHQEDDSTVEDVLQHQALREALELITEEQQQVIVLKFLMECDNAEIARIIGKTESAVKALQRRGLEALWRILGKEIEYLRPSKNDR